MSNKRKVKEKIELSYKLLRSFWIQTAIFF